MININPKAIGTRQFECYLPKLTKPDIKENIPALTAEPKY